MFLFIFESIGTSELILVGIVALILLGPRKLPEMLKKFGKMTAEFRGTANEFKETWQREVNFEEEAKAFDLGDLDAEPVAVKKLDSSGVPVAEPEIREVSPEDLDRLMPDRDDGNHPASAETESTPQANDKKNWL